MHLNPTAMILLKLLLAAALGGAVGLERAVRRKPAGLRTSMFICLGSALFTILSGEIARRLGDPSSTRIVSNLIPGIGFLGAGAIIRERGSVVGLTTAATIFVLAGVGMAVGGGMLWLAGFTVLLILLGLIALGRIEDYFGLKTRLMTFRLATTQLEEVVARTYQVLADMKVFMQHFQVSHVGAEFVMEFDAEVSHTQQQQILGKLSALGARCEVSPLETQRD
jgi:putative Mg2+ transporter-C (MgtC) family protein